MYWSLLATTTFYQFPLAHERQLSSWDGGVVAKGGSRLDIWRSWWDQRMCKIFARFLNMSRYNVIYNSLACINSLHLFMESTPSRVNEVLATLPESFCSASFQGVVHPAIGSDKNPTGLYPEEVPVWPPVLWLPIITGQWAQSTFFFLIRFGFVIFVLVFVFWGVFFAVVFVLCFMYLPLAGQRSWSVWEVSPIFTQERLQ